MNRFIKLLILLPIILYGCSNPFDTDSPQNFCARVFNDTDREVNIYYAVEDYDSFEEDVVVKQEKTKINIGDHILIDIQSVFWDGEFTAKYGGLLNIYEVDEEFMGCRDIHIQIDDFEAIE